MLVTGTTHYVVWVHAESAEEAHEYAASDTYDYIRDDQSVDVWLDAEKDPAETAHFIWLYGSTFMPQHDAHVHTHRAEMACRKREAERAACTAAGHPETEKPLTDGRAWCSGCSRYLDPTELGVS